MTSFKSSLFQKLVLGYNVSRSGKYSKSGARPHVLKSHKSKDYSLSRQEIEGISKSFKIPSTTVEKIYNEIKSISASISKGPPQDMQTIRGKLEGLEREAVSTGAYISSDIKGMISQTKEKIDELESPAEYSNPSISARKQIDELEREKKNLEEAKKAIMGKYYNREIDESSLKSIMDNYEQRLAETEAKIKGLKEEFPKLEKSQREENEQFRTSVIVQPFDLSRVGRLVKRTSSLEDAKLTPSQETQRFTLEEASRILGDIQMPREIKIGKLETVDTNFKKQPGAEGFQVPPAPKKAVKFKAEETEESTPIHLTYPITPRDPAKTDPIFAYANIRWDDSTNKYAYILTEPILTEKLKEVYQKVKEMLEQKLDVDFSQLKKIEAKEFLNKQVDSVLSYFNFTLTDDEKKILKYYMNRDFTGLELIDALMQDPNIEDISCDGIGITLFIFHRNPDIGSVPTNIKFDNASQLDSFIIRLAQLCNKSISVSEPLLDGTLPDGSRIQATLGTDIARRGSNFTIRKFTEEPLTPVHLLNYATLDSNVLAYLWFVVDYGRSILVSGGTASGKTSLLNVLSLFIGSDKKIVSIEDTAELRLPHPHWIPVVARTSIGVGSKGEVDMFDLLRESLRQRPDYIVVGEVRGKEAYVLFQQMATGHPSLATIHAENIARLTDRLTTPPISLPAGLISTLDLVVFLARMKYRNKFIRKVTEIVEIVDFDQVTNKPITNTVFKWNPQTDKFDISGRSVTLKKIADLTGISEKSIRDEIERRIVILDWMKENNILDYRDVHRVFSIYYSDPERLLSAIQGAE